MGLMEFINEEMYIMFSTYYYEVFLYKNKIQVGRLIQPISFNPLFIVDFKRKLAFSIIKECAFVKGHKLILHYNIDFALPLTEYEEIETTEINEHLIKTKSITKLSGNITKEQKEKSKPKTLSEYNLPPLLLFEIYNAHFITKTVSKPKTTDWGVVFGGFILAIVIIAFMAIMVFGLK